MNNKKNVEESTLFDPDLFDPEDILLNNFNNSLDQGINSIDSKYDFSAMKNDSIMIDTTTPERENVNNNQSLQQINSNPELMDVIVDFLSSDKLLVLASHAYTEREARLVSEKHPDGLLFNYSFNFEDDFQNRFKDSEKFKKFENLGLKHIKSFMSLCEDTKLGADNTQGYVMQDKDNRYIVAIAGTDGGKDIKLDYDSVIKGKESDRYIQVIRAAVKLSKTIDKDSPGVLITGHSLGGALSQIFAQAFALHQISLCKDDNKRKPARVDLIGIDSPGIGRYMSKENTTVMTGLTMTTDKLLDPIRKKQKDKKFVVSQIDSSPLISKFIKDEYEKHGAKIAVCHIDAHGSVVGKSGGKRFMEDEKNNYVTFRVNVKELGLLYKIGKAIGSLLRNISKLINLKKTGNTANALNETLLPYSGVKSHSLGKLKNFKNIDLKTKTTVGKSFVDRLTAKSASIGSNLSDKDKTVFLGLYKKMEKEEERRAPILGSDIKTEKDNVTQIREGYKTHNIKSSVLAKVMEKYGNDKRFDFLNKLVSAAPQEHSNGMAR